MSLSQRPIGIFDSGLGGLTVLKAIAKALPSESFSYFGDTARVPYGGKSQQTILRYSIENTVYLMQKGIKLLVVACNTASAYAVKDLEEIFNVPVVDVIRPSIQAVLENSKTGHIAILGTRATIQSGVYQNLLHQAAPELRITAVACPLFVPLVEEGLISKAVTLAVVDEYLKELRQMSVDTLILACTHYPLLEERIQSYMGEEVRIINSAESCAQVVKGLLQAHDIDCKLSPEMATFSYDVSDDAEKFQRNAERFLGAEIKQVSLVQASALH